jgi:glycosyltransferase involved in cell wall biosynthesis
MSSRPKRLVVAAVMPVKTYDPEYLECAINSLFGQTCPDWHLVAVVEPADQARIERALGFWLNDDRIALVTNEGARLAGAINTGTKLAPSEFVSLLFADDLWAPQAVEVLIRNIEAFPETDFFHSSRLIIDDEGRPISSVHRARHSVKLADFWTSAPVKHLLCWRRSMALAIGGLDERSLSVGPDDLDFPWTMAEHGATFKAIEDCLYLYRDHRRVERLTTHLPRRVHTRELRRIFKKHGLSRSEIRERTIEARQTYLRQCLYRLPLEQDVRRRMGWHAQPWRDQYT